MTNLFKYLLSVIYKLCRDQKQQFYISLKSGIVSRSETTILHFFEIGKIPVKWKLCMCWWYRNIFQILALEYLPKNVNDLYLEPLNDWMVQLLNLWSTEIVRPLNYRSMTCRYIHVRKYVTHDLMALWAPIKCDELWYHWKCQAIEPLSHSLESISF